MQGPSAAARGRDAAVAQRHTAVVASRQGAAGAGELLGRVFGPEPGAAAAQAQVRSSANELHMLPVYQVDGGLPFLLLTGVSVACTVRMHAAHRKHAW